MRWVVGISTNLDQVEPSAFAAPRSTVDTLHIFHHVFSFDHVFSDHVFLVFIFLISLDASLAISWRVEYSQSLVLG